MRDFEGFLRRRVLQAAAAALILVLIEALVAHLRPGWRLIKIGNEMFLLSALVQVDASIFAIVVSLTLIMAEIISTSYSVDLLGVLFREKRLKLFVLLYGLVIFLGILVLKFVSESLVSDFFVFLTIALSAVAFESLWHYLMATRDLLRPTFLAATLVRELPVEDMLEEYRTERVSRDHFSVIESFVHGVVAKGDLKTLALVMNRLNAKIKAPVLGEAHGLPGALLHPQELLLQVPEDVPLCLDVRQPPDDVLHGHELPEGRGAGPLQE